MSTAQQQPAWKYADSEGALLRMAPGQRLQIYRIGGQWAEWSSYRDWFLGTPLDETGAQALINHIEVSATRRRPG